jgi:hypothetical protein
MSRVSKPVALPVLGGGIAGFCHLLETYRRPAALKHMLRESTVQAQP